MTILLLFALLFAAPYLYWSCILLPIISNAAHSEGILLGLHFINALGGAVLLLVMFLGLGGCLSATRAGVLNNDLTAGECSAEGAPSVDISLPRAIWRGLRRCAGASLLYGGFTGLSLGVFRVGVLQLHCAYPAGFVRVALDAVLVLQAAFTLAACLLLLRQPDAVQAKPLRAFAAAWVRAARIGRWRLIPSVALSAFLFFGTLAAISLPLLKSRLSVVRSSLREALAFAYTLVRQDAANGTLRDLLSNSGSWIVLLLGLLGGACCIIAAYLCACHRFHGRMSLFAVIVLLQLLPLWASFSAMDQFLRNLNLPDRPFYLGLALSLLYILTAALLFHRFSKLKDVLAIPQTAALNEWRLFFYNVFPKVRPYVLALAILISAGLWNDAVLPFVWMHRLGAFRLPVYVWQQSRWDEKLFLLLLAFLALPLFVLALARHIHIKRKKR